MFVAHIDNRHLTILGPVRMGRLSILISICSVTYIVLAQCTEVSTCVPHSAFRWYSTWKRWFTASGSQNGKCCIPAACCCCDMLSTRLATKTRMFPFGELSFGMVMSTTFVFSHQ